MRNLILALAASIMIVFGVSCQLLAEEAVATVPQAESIAVNTVVGAGEIRDYKVDVAIKGNMLNPDTKEPLDLDTTLTMKICHKYGTREGDGLLPLEIRMLSGEATSNGEKLMISPSIYPKLTVLLNKNFGIDDIYGITQVVSGSLPGVNYGNIIMLFYVPQGDKPHVIGEKWESIIALPSLNESYKVISTIKSAQQVAGSKLLTLHQDFERVPQKGVTGATPQMTAAVDSTFSADNGKLIKSHVECDVAFGPKSTDEKPASGQFENSGKAHIKMDITTAK